MTVRTPPLYQLSVTQATTLREAHSDKIKKRDILIDILKGYAIFLVIWGHTIQFFGEGLDLMNQYVGKYIYIFHMPLFFFMSAYVSDRTFKMNFKEMIRLRFKTLIVPLFSFSIIQFFLSIIIILIFKSSLITLQDIGREFVYKIVGSYWFIIILFCFILLTNLAYKFSVGLTHKYKSSSILLILCCIWLTSFLIPRPNLQYSIYITYLQGMYPFFIFGWLFKRLNIVEWIKKYNLFTSIISGALFIIMLIWFSKNDFIYFQNYSFWNNSITFLDIFVHEGKLIVGGLIGIIFTIAIISTIIKYVRPLQYWGKNTLGMYLIQGVIFNVFLINYCPLVNNDILYFLISILITFVSYSLTVLLSKFELGRFVLGKKAS